MYIISACLAGVSCKYDGGNNLREEILTLVKEGKGVLVCPEQLGGLSTPRPPSEIIKMEDRIQVMNNLGENVTDYFIKGGKETLNIARAIGVQAAIFKSRSPSCGCGYIYDGTFKGILKRGNGITTDMLIRNGIKVFTEEEFIKSIIE